MSTNLRLPDELATALRDAAARSGRSQQDIIRAALAKELGLTTSETGMDRAIRLKLVEEPEPFREVVPALRLPAGQSTLDLLEREDR